MQVEHVLGEDNFDFHERSLLPQFARLVRWIVGAVVFREHGITSTGIDLAAVQQGVFPECSKIDQREEFLRRGVEWRCF